jgi:NADPH:quinone reductase-like Zn-dependent oxidoreductase
MTEVSSMMAAVCALARGGPEQLAYREAESPAVGIGDVLVRVEAASFTPTELGWPSTWVDRTGAERLPVIPGHEVSGVVEGIGYGTMGFQVGDAVFGLTDWYRDGSLAEYVAVEARNLALKPESLSHTEAVALAMPGLTAWQALFRIGRLTPGQRLLVHGAAGGVGTVAVQLGRASGAEVFATGRTQHRELVLGLGASEFIDADRFPTSVQDIDLVFDLVGGELLERSWPAVRPSGMIVSAVAPVISVAEVRGVFFVVEPDRADLVELGERVEAGQVRPLVNTVMPLSRAREAFEAKQTGGLPGKVVFDVGGAATSA